MHVAGNECSSSLDTGCLPVLSITRPYPGAHHDRGTDIQAMTINRWGLPKALLTPRLVIPSHVFLGLLIVSPLLLDLHLRTLFPKYPVSVGATAGFTLDPAIAAGVFGIFGSGTLQTSGGLVFQGHRGADMVS